MRMNWIVVMRMIWIIDQSPAKTAHARHVRCNDILAVPNLLEGPILLQGRDVVVAVAAAAVDERHSDVSVGVAEVDWIVGGVAVSVGADAGDGWDPPVR